MSNKMQSPPLVALDPRQRYSIDEAGGCTQI
jgi:hypothetical protein